MIAQTPSSVKPTILFVDDEPKLCYIVSRILGEDGYNVVTVENGFDALEATSRVNPDIIVLDIIMPGMDGIALLREIRKRGMKCPVIMLTGEETIDTARESMTLGAFGYMTKPFNHHFFKKMLRDALAERDDGRVT